MKKGILYCATEGNASGGRLQFLEECEISAKRVKELHPDIGITLVVDHATEKSIECFDEVIQFDKKFLNSFPSKNNFLIKNLAFLSSPYEHTIFLDSDTYIINEECILTELFEETKEYDFCATLEPASPNYDIFSTGVVSFKKTYSFLMEWLRISGGEATNDQDSLEKILISDGSINEFNLKIKVLHHKWNWRDRKINGRVSDTKNINKRGLHKHQIKILHNRWRLQKMGIFK
jgi:hypothetical protein